MAGSLHYFPRTQRSGRVDQKLFAALGRAESLRLIADYTGTPLDAKTAADTLARAETFVCTVAEAFSLNESSIARDLENDTPNPEDKISEPNFVPMNPELPEEIRRQARENWLKLRRK